MHQRFLYLVNCTRIIIERSDWIFINHSTGMDTCVVLWGQLSPLNYNKKISLIKNRYYSYKIIFLKYIKSIRNKKKNKLILILLFYPFNF